MARRHRTRARHPSVPADVHAKLTELRELVAQARSMPLSASCLLNRADALARIAEIDAALPGRLTEADRVLADADAVVAEAREQAVAVLAEAAVERDRRLELTAEGGEASAWAAQIRAEAEADATSRTAEVDDYVDGQLANFEVVLEKTLELARRGPEDPDADPAAQVENLAASLERALVAVHRGRERLHGRLDMEDLGEHLRSMEDPPGDPAGDLMNDSFVDPDPPAHRP